MPPQFGIATCWVTKISLRHVAFVAVMRPPRPNLKIKHEINYGIESVSSRGARKLKLCLFQICYNNTYNKHNVKENDSRVRYIGRSIIAINAPMCAGILVKHSS